VISLKRYLDMDPSQPSSDGSDLNELSAAVLESYRAAVLAMGKSGQRACPAVGSELQQALTSLETRLSANVTSLVVKETGIEVEEQLLRWGGHAAEYFQTKANEVKELLIVLASAAESMGKRDKDYADHFGQFTAQLQAIAGLEDLVQVRSSLIKHASELKTYIERIQQESRKSVAQLQAEVQTYETKLNAAEQLALQDPLTGLANRRKVEDRIEWRIAHQRAFCIAILDLERFKQVNDTYGHPAGDDLLQQFSRELQSNSRSTDIVGRWGGDEFVIIMDCDLATAQSQIERLQKWALGEYTIRVSSQSSAAKIKVDASVGLAQWEPGQSLEKLIANADSSMYRNKAQTRRQKA
jgi:diguanylate cyclase (GGDEF)-like protein